MNTLQRTTSTALLTGVLAMLCWMSLLMGSAAWIAYEEDTRYETSALRSDGRISGYTYWDGGTGKNAHRKAGYYANVTFSTADGPVTIRSERRYDTPEHRNAMLGWEVDVLYFPGETGRARIVQWSEPLFPFTVPVLLLCVFACLSVVWLIRRQWRPSPVAGSPQRR